jgi:hypothetical protein
MPPRGAHFFFCKSKEFPSDKNVLRAGASRRAGFLPFYFTSPAGGVRDRETFKRITVKEHGIKIKRFNNMPSPLFFFFWMLVVVSLIVVQDRSRVTAVGPAAHNRP